MNTWQVEISTITPIPFVRDRYSVAVSGIFVTFPANQIPTVFHITSTPLCEGGEGHKFWIGSTPCGTILKSCINKEGKKIVGLYFHPNELEYCPVNFLENWSFQIRLIDDAGKNVNCSGYCILKITENS